MTKREGVSEEYNLLADKAAQCQANHKEKILLLIPDFKN